MIGELRLFELLNRYGVNPKNILDLKKDKVLSYGEYKSIEYVLEYLRTYLSIKARRIELCPSILYFGVENIKANYEFLESQGFNVLKLNNCFHILSCDTLRLRESFSYGICMLSGKPISMAVLYKMYGQLGYSEQDVDNVVKKIEALGSMMRSL